MEKLWTCPNCGGEMKKFTDILTPCYVCTKCGCSLEAKEKNFHPGNSCPNCHRSFDDDLECPHCGYDFGSDFE